MASTTDATQIPRPILSPPWLNVFALACAGLWLLAIGLTLTPEIDDFVFYWQGSLQFRQTGDPYRDIPEQARDSIDELIAHKPWGAYLYPPLLAYALQPLARLPHPQAQLIWFGLNLVLVLGFIGLSIHLSAARLARRYWGVVVLLALIAPPTRLSLQLGQVSILLALLLTLVLVLKHRPALAGLLLALASLIKIYPALLGGYFLLRQRSVAAWCVGAGLGLLALTTLLHGFGPYRSYLEKVLLRSSSFPYAAEFNISLVGFWRRLLLPSPFALAPVDLPLLATLLSALSALGLLGVCVWASRGYHDGAQSGLLFCAWLCAMLLLSPLNGYYNLLVLLLPLLLALRQLELRPDPALLRWLLVGTLLVCIPPTWSDAIPALYQTLHSGWWLVLLTPSIYGLLIYFGVLIVLARRSSPSEYS